MMDVERWPEWTDSMDKVEKLDTGELQVGSKVRIKQPRLPAAVWQVSAIEPGHYMEWRASGPGANAIAGHRVEPEGAGSRLILSIEQGGVMSTLFGWWLDKITKRYVAMEAEGLKRRAEGIAAG
jgi:hypothetical protein